MEQNVSASEAFFSCNTPRHLIEPLSHVVRCIIIVCSSIADFEPQHFRVYETMLSGLGSQEQQSADTSQPATSTPDNGREATQQQSQETEPPTPQESADGPVGDQPSPEGQEGGTPDQQGEQAPPPEQNASSGGEGNSKESPKTEKKKVQR